MNPESLRYVVEFKENVKGTKPEHWTKIYESKEKALQVVTDTNKEVNKDIRLVAKYVGVAHE